MNQSAGLHEIQNLAQESGGAHCRGGQDVAHKGHEVLKGTSDTVIRIATQPTEGIC